MLASHVWLMPRCLKTHVDHSLFRSPCTHLQISLSNPCSGKDLLFVLCFYCTNHHGAAWWSVGGKQTHEMKRSEKVMWVGKEDTHTLVHLSGVRKQAVVENIIVNN